MLYEHQKDRLHSLLFRGPVWLLRKWWKEREEESMWMCCAVEGAVTGEKDVLKLVHPGRFIEIHTEPIPAFEVLNKYPRHCITRPDVFKFPWIVVKPESLLLPGKVFFLVPKRTIYNLIKASSQQQRPSSPPPCPSSSFSPFCSKTNVHRHGNSPTKLLAGMTPKHQSPGQSMSNSYEIAEETKLLTDYSSYWTRGVQKRNECRGKEGDCSRSCLRKAGSSRTSLRLKVQFLSDYQ